MVDSAGVGNFATVSVVRAVGFWDYILFFGSFLIIGIAGFFATKFAYRHFKNKNDVKNIGIDSYEN